MSEPTPEQDFRRWRRRGDTAALGRVFDALAPELLLVAAHLAGGSAAEDLVQATFVDAIEQRERWDEARPLGPWLCGMLVNHVRRELRRRHQAPDPTRLLAGEVSTPRDAAEASELADQVRAAVARLPRQYHLVVTLRFVHGFELQQIAQTLRLPLGTVKTRLYRGMAMVKRSLPAGLATAFAAVMTPGRGLAAVRAVVLGHAGAAVGTAAAAGGAAVVVSGAVIGAVLMQKAMLAVGAVLVAAGGWLAVQSLQPAAVAIHDEARAHEHRAAADAGGSATAPNAPAELRVDAAMAAQRLEAATTGSIEVQANWRSDGTPASRAQLVWIRSADRARSAVERADANGRVVFADLSPGVYRVRPGMPGEQQDFGFQGALVAESAHKVGLPYEPPSVDVTVLPGETASCTLAIDSDQHLLLRVVDLQGVAQADAEIWCIDCGDALASHPLGRTNDRGVLDYHGVPVQAVWARKHGLQPSRAMRLPWASYPEPMTLVLGGSGCRVEGVVLDPAGRRAKAATVAIADDSLAAMGATRTNMMIQIAADPEGRFVCDELPIGDLAVLALADGFAPARSRVQTSVGEPVVTTLTLHQGATIRGRVAHADGSPGANVGVQVREQSGALYGFEEFSVSASHSAVTNANGEFRLNLVLPGKNELVLFTPSPMSRVLVLRDGEQRTCDLVLTATRQIAGTVVDGAGKPRAGWRVETDGPGQTNSVAVSDANGRFVLSGLQDDAYRVFAFDATATGAAARVPYARADSVRAGTDDLVLQLDDSAGRGGYLEGRVVWPEGARTGVELSLIPRNPGPRYGGVPQQHLESGTQSFEIGPLPAGDYDLTCDAHDRERIRRTNLHVAAGERFAVPTLRLDQQRPLWLQLVTADGKPASGAVVKVSQAGGIHACTEESVGSFRSLPLSAGSHEVLVYGAHWLPMRLQVETGADASTPTRHMLVEAAPTTLRFLPPGPRDRLLCGMRLELEDASGLTLLDDFLQVDGTDHFDWSIGLKPGGYVVRAVMLGEGMATVPFVVPSHPGDSVVEVRIERRH